MGAAEVATDPGQTNRPRLWSTAVHAFSIACFALVMLYIRKDMES